MTSVSWVSSYRVSVGDMTVRVKNIRSRPVGTPTLNAPGKFLISASEHAIPSRARAYLVTDEVVAETACQTAGCRWAPSPSATPPHRPPPPGRHGTRPPSP
ncbi:MAG TPA: hypothetical protein VHZ03_46785 [Trebonia sp.]|nr:hypothetical protein [Trebonia sp.]